MNPCWCQSKWNGTLISITGNTCIYLTILYYYDYCEKERPAKLGCQSVINVLFNEHIFREGKLE